MTNYCWISFFFMRNYNKHVVWKGIHVDGLVYMCSNQFLSLYIYSFIVHLRDTCLNNIYLFITMLSWSSVNSFLFLPFPFISLSLSLFCVCVCVHLSRLIIKGASFSPYFHFMHAIGLYMFKTMFRMFFLSNLPLSLSLYKPVDILLSLCIYIQKTGGKE